MLSQYTISIYPMTRGRGRGGRGQGAPSPSDPNAFLPARVFNSRNRNQQQQQHHTNPTRTAPTPPTGIPTPAASVTPPPPPAHARVPNTNRNTYRPNTDPNTQTHSNTGPHFSSPSDPRGTGLETDGGRPSRHDQDRALRGNRKEFSFPTTTDGTRQPPFTTRPPFTRQRPPPRTTAELKTTALSKAHQLLSDAFGDPAATPPPGSNAARFRVIRQHLATPRGSVDAPPLHLTPWDEPDLSVTAPNPDGTAGAIYLHDTDIFDPAVLGPTLHEQAQQQKRPVTVSYFPEVARNFDEAFTKKTLTWSHWVASAITTVQLNDVQYAYITKPTPPLVTPRSIGLYVSGSSLQLMRPFLASTLIRRPTDENPCTTVSFRLSASPTLTPIILDPDSTRPLLAVPDAATSALDLVSKLQGLKYLIAATAPTLQHLHQIPDVTVTHLDDTDTVAPLYHVTFPTEPLASEFIKRTNEFAAWRATNNLDEHHYADFVNSLPLFAAPITELTSDINFFILKPPNSSALKTRRAHAAVLASGSTVTLAELAVPNSIVWSLPLVDGKVFARLADGAARKLADKGWVIWNGDGTDTFTQPTDSRPPNAWGQRLTPPPRPDHYTVSITNFPDMSTGNAVVICTAIFRATPVCVTTVSTNPRQLTRTVTVEFACIPPTTPSSYYLSSCASRITVLNHPDTLPTTEPVALGDDPAVATPTATMMSFTAEMKSKHTEHSTTTKAASYTELTASSTVCHITRASYTATAAEKRAVADLITKPDARGETKPLLAVGPVRAAFNGHQITKIDWDVSHRLPDAVDALKRRLPLPTQTKPPLYTITTGTTTRTHDPAEYRGGKFVVCLVGSGSVHAHSDTDKHDYTHIQNGQFAFIPAHTHASGTTHQQTATHSDAKKPKQPFITLSISLPTTSDGDHPMDTTPAPATTSSTSSSSSSSSFPPPRHPPPSYRLQPTAPHAPSQNSKCVSASSKLTRSTACDTRKSSSTETPRKPTKHFRFKLLYHKTAAELRSLKQQGNALGQTEPIADDSPTVEQNARKKKLKQDNPDAAAHMSADDPPLLPLDHQIGALSQQLTTPTNTSSSSSSSPQPEHHNHTQRGTHQTEVNTLHYDNSRDRHRSPIHRHPPPNRRQLHHYLHTELQRRKKRAALPQRRRTYQHPRRRSARNPQPHEYRQPILDNVGHPWNHCRPGRSRHRHPQHSLLTTNQHPRTDTTTRYRRPRYRRNT